MVFDISEEEETWKTIIEEYKDDRNHQSLKLREIMQIKVDMPQITIFLKY